MSQVFVFRGSNVRIRRYKNDRIELFRKGKIKLLHRPSQKNHSVRSGGSGLNYSFQWSGDAQPKATFSLSSQGRHAAMAPAEVDYGSYEIQIDDSGQLTLARLEDESDANRWEELCLIVERFGLPQGCVVIVDQISEDLPCEKLDRRTMNPLGDQSMTQVNELMAKWQGKILPAPIGLKFGTSEPRLIFGQLFIASQTTPAELAAFLFDFVFTARVGSETPMPQRPLCLQSSEDCLAYSKALGDITAATKWIADRLNVLFNELTPARVFICEKMEGAEGLEFQFYHYRDGSPEPLLSQVIRFLASRHNFVWEALFKVSDLPSQRAFFEGVRCQEDNVIVREIKAYFHIAVFITPGFPRRVGISLAPKLELNEELESFESAATRFSPPSELLCLGDMLESETLDVLLSPKYGDQSRIRRLENLLISRADFLLNNYHELPIDWDLPATYRLKLKLVRHEGTFLLGSHGVQDGPSFSAQSMDWREITHAEIQENACGVDQNANLSGSWRFVSPLMNEEVLVPSEEDPDKYFEGCYRFFCPAGKAASLNFIAEYGAEGSKQLGLFNLSVQYNPDRTFTWFSKRLDGIRGLRLQKLAGDSFVVLDNKFY